MSKYCPKCGYENNKDSKFCVKCGNRFPVYFEREQDFDYDESVEEEQTKSEYNQEKDSDDSYLEAAIPYAKTKEFMEQEERKIIYDFGPAIREYVATKSQKAAEDIYNHSKDTFERAVSRFLRRDDEEEVSDAIQEIFIKIFNKLDTLKATEAYISWGLKISVNYTINANKKKKRLQERTANVSSAFASGDEDSDVLDYMGNIEDVKRDFKPEAKLLSFEEWGLLKEYLQQIPEKQMQAIMLFKEGYSYKEIAGILGINEHTAKSDVNYAKKKLTKLITKAEKEGKISIRSMAPVTFIFWMLDQYDAAMEAQTAETAAGVATEAAAGKTAAPGSSAADEGFRKLVESGRIEVRVDMIDNQIDALERVNDSAQNPNTSDLNSALGNVAAVTEKAAGSAISTKAIVAVIVTVGIGIAGIGGYLISQNKNASDNETVETPAHNEDNANDQDETTEEVESVDVTELNAEGIAGVLGLDYVGNYTLLQEEAIQMNRQGLISSYVYDFDGDSEEEILGVLSDNDSLEIAIYEQDGKSYRKAGSYKVATDFPADLRNISASEGSIIQFYQSTIVFAEDGHFYLMSLSDTSGFNPETVIEELIYDQSESLEVVDTDYQWDYFDYGENNTILISGRVRAYMNNSIFPDEYWDDTTNEYLPQPMGDYEEYALIDIDYTDVEQWYVGDAVIYAPKFYNDLGIYYIDGTPELEYRNYGRTKDSWGDNAGVPLMDYEGEGDGMSVLHLKIHDRETANDFMIGILVYEESCISDSKLNSYSDVYGEERYQEVLEMERMEEDFMNSRNGQN